MSFGCSPGPRVVAPGMIILLALLQAATQPAPAANLSAHPIRDVLRFCTNLVTRSRETTHPRTIGFKSEPGSTPRLELPGGHWIDLRLSRDLKSVTCGLSFDGNQDDAKTNLAVGLEVDRHRLKRVDAEYKPRRAGTGIYNRKVEDAATITYEGLSNGRRLSIVHHQLSQVSGDEDSGRDHITVIGHTVTPESARPIGADVLKEVP